jgi:hypothetical protein
MSAGDWPNEVQIRHLHAPQAYCRVAFILNLSDYGVTKAEIPALAKNAMETMGGLFRVDPVVLGYDDVVAIYEGCF